MSHCLPSAFTTVSCSTYSSTLKMEAIFFSQTSVEFQRTTRHCTPEDRTRDNHRSEKLITDSSLDLLPLQGQIFFLVFLVRPSDLLHVSYIVRAASGFGFQIHFTNALRISYDTSFTVSLISVTPTCLLTSS
jgi:hypothetical protein